MKRAFALAFALALAACTHSPAPPTAPAPLAIPSIASASASTAPARPEPAATLEAPEYARALVTRTSEVDMLASANEILRRVGAGEPVEPGAVDALWQCFSAFRPSKTTSLGLVKALHDAVLAVKAPSYGPKAAALLEVRVRDPNAIAERLDQLQFLQATAAQIIAALGYADGVRPLVDVLLTPEKHDLEFIVRNALAGMPDASEPVLIATLGASDRGAPQIADTLARISRPAGRDAVLAALDTAANDETRASLAMFLPAFPDDPDPNAKLVPAFQRAYAKIAADATTGLLAGANARAALLGSAAGFYDPALVPWILKQIAARKGDAADELVSDGFPAAIRLMTTASAPLVASGLSAAKSPRKSFERQLFQSADAVLAQCKQDPTCYANILDAPLASTDIMVTFGHVKAAWMAAIYGNAAIRDVLVKKLARIREGSIRVAVLDAIVHLSPRGDRPSAGALDALVATERAGGRVVALDEINVASRRLRGRAR